MTSISIDQRSETDQKNSAFWDELCGTQLANSLGIEDDSPESLRKFDEWYFEFYPYLFDYIPFAKMENKSVLEIGLGYGTVAQKIGESGARYHGLDIASGPTSMVRLRHDRLGLDSEVFQQSILDNTLEKGSYDWVVAIGCLHHTGDLEGAIKEVHKLLKPDGEAIIMVYSAASYRQWFTSPTSVLKRVFLAPGYEDESSNAAGKMRAMYDVNSAGDAAPQTEFVTASELRHLCRMFRSCQVRSENIGSESILRFFNRRLMCGVFGRIVGLDLYCKLQR